MKTRTNQSVSRPISQNQAKCDQILFEVQKSDFSLSLSWYLCETVCSELFSPFFCFFAGCFYRKLFFFLRRQNIGCCVRCVHGNCVGFSVPLLGPHNFHFVLLSHSPVHVLRYACVLFTLSFCISFSFFIRLCVSVPLFCALENVIYARICETISG